MYFLVPLHFHRDIVDEAKDAEESNDLNENQQIE